MTPDESAAVATTQTAGRPSVYSADRPLLSAGDDRLGRRSFADRIADSLATRTDPSSLVIGIYGEWGDGKSTVLNFIEQRLRESAAESVVCVRFNPWLYGDEPTLIEEFFRLLGETIDAKVSNPMEKVGDHLRRLGSVVRGASFGTSTVTASGTVIESLGALLPAVSLAKLRNRVEAALKGAHVRVVVFIDDIDRLDRDEITTVIRLVKAAADFSYTAYVLAFDESVVSAALAARYPDSPTGQNFLEKIVQVPLSLPRTDPAVVRRILLEDVERLFSAHEILLTPDEGTRLWTTLDEAVLPRLRTVRVARRLSNAVEFALPIMPNEVNPVDVVLVEALGTLYPTAYTFVKASVGWIVSPVIGRLSRDDADRLAPAARDLSPSEAASCQKLMRRLFPQLDSVFSNVVHSTDEAKAWMEQRRVCRPRYCERFFSYGIPVGDVADAEILQLMRTATTDQVGESLGALSQRAGAGLVLQKLSDRLSDVAPDELLPLARMLCNYAPRLDGIASAGFGTPAVLASYIVVRLVQELHTHERIPAVQALIETTDERFAILIFRMLRAYSGPEAETPGFSEAEVAQPGGEFAEHLLSLDSTEPLVHRWPQSAPEMYWHCEHYGSKERVIERIIGSAKASIGEAAAFVRAFLPDVDHFAGEYSMSGWIGLRYNEFAGLLPADHLADAVRVNLPDVDERVRGFLQNPAAGPRVDDLEAETQAAASVAIRFVALHQLMTRRESVVPEPTVAAQPAESLSVSRGSPNSTYAFDDRRDATLTIRVLTELPQCLTEFTTSGSVASALTQTERDALVLALLEGAEVTALIRTQLAASRDGLAGSWELRGDNLGDRSRAHFVPTSDAAPTWAIAYFQTGWLPIDGEPTAGEPTQGLRLVLDVKFNLQHVDRDEDDNVTTAIEPLPLTEVADTIVAALGSVNVALEAFEKTLHGAGDVQSVLATCWIEGSNVGLDQIIDVSAFRPIPGNPARSQESFGWSLEMPRADDSPVLARWPEQSRRDAVREFLRVILQRMGRRDFEATLNELWTPARAESDGVRS